MPMIEVTQEQYEAYNDGRAITVTPPTKYVLSIVSADHTRQSFHTKDLMARSAKDAVLAWVSDFDRVGSHLVHVCLPALVVVCPASTPGYTMHTINMEYFRVSRDFKITTWDA